MEVPDDSTNFLSIYQQSGFQILQYPLSKSPIRVIGFANDDARNTPNYSNELKFILVPEGGFRIESVDGMVLAAPNEVT